MSEPAEQFTAAVEDLFREQVVGFARWIEEHWTMKAEDRDEDLTVEAREGWNKCCKSIEAAMECWMESQR